jgi:hypothetical protein
VRGRSNECDNGNQIGIDTMGWQIMGTEHLGVKATDATVLSDEEVVERAIDWLEDAGMTLLPWQAEAFRAIMLQPVKSRFMVATPQHPQHRGTPRTNAILSDIAQRGFTGVAVQFDEAGQMRTELPDAPRPGMVKVYRDGEWTWV